MAERALPASLAREGDMMLQTLLAELSSVTGQTVTLSRDKRMPLNKRNITQFLIEHDLQKQLKTMINESDLTWLIAPETGDCLATYTEQCTRLGKLHIGCTAAAVRRTASKLKTYQILTTAGIPALATNPVDAAVPESHQGWVVKPDDGVGAEGCYVYQTHAALDRFRSEHSSSPYVIQPCIHGEHLSMSLLVYREALQLLACNRQYISRIDNKIIFNGVGVNECLEYRDEFCALAHAVVQAVPGLAGYIGIDLIKARDEFYIVDINPRLTTAYVGLSESLAMNITEKILSVFLTEKMMQIDLSDAKPVRVVV